MYRYKTMLLLALLVTLASPPLANLNAQGRHLVGFLGMSSLFAAPIYSPQPTAAARQAGLKVPTYPDSAEGLRSLLLDAVVAAKSGDSQKLAAFLKETEIPDYQKWFTKTYGKERGSSWAEPYGRDLSKNETEMQNLLAKFANEDGGVEVRKVNGELKGGEKGLEWGLVHSAKQRVDIFYAAWRAAATSDATNADPIGYFMFIEGQFRWDSNIRVIPIRQITVTDSALAAEPSRQDARPAVTGDVFRPGKDGVGYPSCADCPVPAYTQEARDAKFEGTVLLQVVIGPDGRATDIKVLRKVGYGLDDIAVKTVQNWRFKPALGPGGKPVAVLTPIELAFRLR